MKLPLLLLLGFPCLSLPVAAGLLAYYPFDGNALDATPGGRHLTAYATNGVDKPQFFPTGGRTGGFARFDGQNLLNTTWLPVTGNGDRTLMLWIRTRSSNLGTNGTTTTFFAGWGSPDLATRVRFDLGFEANTNNRLRNEYNAGAITSNNTTDVTGGMWHHVAVTYVGSTRTATFYLNGAPYGSGVAAGNLATGGGTPDVGLTLGADVRAAGVRTGVSTQTPNRFFKGDIDEVRVYDHALTATEIAAYFDDLRDNGPQVIFFEPDIPVSPPGATRKLRFQVSTAVTAATIDQGVGSVLPVDAFGYGEVEVSPNDSTLWTLATTRGSDAGSGTTRIRVSDVPEILDFTYHPSITRGKMFLFMPDSTKDYRLKRGTSLVDGFPDTISTQITPAFPYIEVRDPAAPVGRAFYRLEEESVFPGS